MTARAIQGLRSWSDGGTVAWIAAGSARDQHDGLEIVLPATRQVSVSSLGLGGIDSGTVQPNQLYALYVVLQGTNAGGMLSTSFTAPSTDLPFRRVGAVLTNGNAEIVAFSQSGIGVERSVVYLATPNVLVLVDGEASDTGFTAFDLAPPNPPTSRTARLHIAPTGGTTRLRAGGGGAEIVIVEPTNLGFTPPIGTDKGSFQTSAGSTTTIRVTGFSDTL